MNYPQKSRLFMIRPVTVLGLFMYMVLFTAFLFPGKDAFGFYSVEWSFFAFAAILIYVTSLAVLHKGVLKFKKDHIFILIAVFYTFVLLSILDTPNKIKGLLYAGQYIPYFFIMYLAIDVINSEEKLLKTIDMLTVLISIYSFIVIVASIKIGDRYNLNEFLLNTFNVGILKMLSLMELPFCILTFRVMNERLIPLRLFIFLLISIAVVLSGSRGSYIIWALTVSLSILKRGNLKRKVIFLLIGGIIIAVLVLNTNYALKSIDLMVVSNSADFEEKITRFSRLYTAKCAFHIMLANPINGIGVGNLSYVMEEAVKNTPGIPEAIIQYWEKTHLFETQTTPLKLGAELGLCGFIFFFFFYHYLFKRAKRSCSVSSEGMKSALEGAKIAIIVSFVHNFFDVSFYNYYSWFYYGIIIAATRIATSHNGYTLQKS